MAQIVIPPHSAVYNGYTRGFNFTSQTNFFIVQLDLPLDAFQAGDTASYMVRVNGVEVYRSVGNAGAVGTSLPILTGDIVDVFGNWSPAVPGSFTAHNSYTASQSSYTTTIEGVSHVLNRTGWQWDIGDASYTSGAALAPTSTGQLGRVLVTTSTSSGGTLATNTTLGSSCGLQGSSSFYELFSNAGGASATLSGNSLQLIPTANGYQGIWLPGTAAALYHTPVAATTLATGDDGVVVYNITSGTLPTPYGAQTALQVSGNGILGFGATGLDYPGTSSYTPTNAGFNNSTSGGIYSWHDFNSGEAGSGPINAEEVGGVLYISFVGVENYSATTMPNPSTLQFQLDLASGIVTIVWVSIDGDTTSAFGSAHLVGVTAPGASLDFGSVSLATGTAQQLSSISPDIARMNLAATSRPVLGTNWNLSATNIPLTTVFGVNLWGTADPNVPDLFFLGMPGCQLRSTLDVIAGPWLPAAGSYSYSFAVPATPPSLVGFNLFAQVATFDAVPVNAFGAITSNGIQGVLGDL